MTSKSRIKSPDEDKFGADIKLIIIGNSSTGKTSIVNQFINKKFSKEYSATIASDFQYKLLKIGNLTYRIQFWDLAGQDKSQTYIGLFCRDIHGIIICCSCDDPKSREDTIEWKNSLNDLKENWVPIILCENKCDVLGDTDDDYLKDVESLKKFAEDNNFLTAYRVSAKNNYNIDDMITYLINYIKDNFADKIVNSYITESNDDNLSQQSGTIKNIKNNKNKNCCLIF